MKRKPLKEQKESTGGHGDARFHFLSKVRKRGIPGEQHKVEDILLNYCKEHLLAAHKSKKVEYHIDPKHGEGYLNRS